jgi:hypothetical protein
VLKFGQPVHVFPLLLSRVLTFGWLHVCKLLLVVLDGAVSVLVHDLKRSYRLDRLRCKQLAGEQRP